VGGGDVSGGEEAAAGADGCDELSMQPMCWPAGAVVCSLAHTLRWQQGKTGMQVRALFANWLNKYWHSCSSLCASGQTRAGSAGRLLLSTTNRCPCAYRPRGYCLLALLSKGYLLVWLSDSLSHAFGAVFDNPELTVACMIGDGEAEIGPLVTVWHSNKFLAPATDGAVPQCLRARMLKAEPLAASSSPGRRFR
jgi:hypothetical protein